MTNTDFPFGVMSMSPASAQEKKKKDGQSKRDKP